MNSTYATLDETGNSIDANIPQRYPQGVGEAVVFFVGLPQAIPRVTGSDRDRLKFPTLNFEVRQSRSATLKDKRFTNTQTRHNVSNGMTQWTP